MTWEARGKVKEIAPEDLDALTQRLRCEGKSLATLNGSFDLLHAGHLYILYEAAAQADCLLVALNSDVSIRTYKGTHRPLISLPERMKLLTALECVDYVTWFEETDPRALLKRIRPDVHVNGAEYGPNCIEAAVVKEIGARLHLVARQPGLATSALIQKIVSTSCA